MTTQPLHYSKPAGVCLSAGEKPSDQVKEAAVQLRRDMVKAHVWPCCLNCMEWRERTVLTPTSKSVTMQCGRYQMTPPPEVIVVGCRDYEQDIPF